MSQRDGSIETLRGLAIVFMVAGHVIGPTREIAMGVSDDSPWRYFYDVVQPYRMPLFTAISGFVYALRPLESGQLGCFAGGKLRRLLLPLVAVATLQFLWSHWVGRGTPYCVADMWMIYLFPFDQFWFLQSLTVVFAVVASLELLGVFRSSAGWATVLAAAAWVYVTMPDAPPLFFSVHGAAFLLPFFLLGMGLRRYRALFSHPLTPRLLGAGFCISFVAHQAQLIDWNRWFTGGSGQGLVRLFLGDGLSEGLLSEGLLSEGLLSGDGLIGGVASVSSPVVKLVAGLTGCWLFLSLRGKISQLAWLGRHSYTIFLWHMFGVAGSQIALTRLLGIHSEVLVFSLGVGTGLSLPILLDWMLQMVPGLGFVLLGKTHAAPVSATPRGSPQLRAGRATARRIPSVAEVLGLSPTELRVARPMGPLAREPNRA